MKNKAIFIVFILVQLISCAKKNNEAQKLPSSNNQIPILNPTDWQEFVLGEDERKLLKIRKLEASKFFLEDQKKKYLQTALVNVPVDPKYNVSLFKIAGIDIYKDTIFIGPKVFAYGPNEGAKIIKNLINEESAKISFPILLTSGIETKILSPRGQNELVDLPRALLIHGIEDLRESLKNRFGNGTNLSILPGCPKEVTIEAYGRSYKSSPLNFGSSSFCDGGSPFSVTLEMNHDEVNEVINNGLLDGALDLSVRYETRVKVISSKIIVDLDRGKFISLLSENIDLDNGVTMEELIPLVVNILNQKLSTIYSDEIKIKDNIELYSKAVIKEFFEGSAENNLFKINNLKAYKKAPYNYEWNVNTVDFAGESYLSWTKLQAANKTITIGGDSKRATLDYNNSFGLGMHIGPGQIVEIRPTKLYREMISHSEKPVGYISEMIDHGDAFTEIHTYSNDNYSLITAPIGQIEDLFGGLFFKFTWYENGVFQERECPVKMFNWQGDGQAIRVEVTNREGCEIFSANLDFNQRNNPELHMVNKISLPEETHTVGRLTSRYAKVRWGAHHQWTRDERVEVTKRPKTKFSGVISLLAYGLENAN